MTSSAYGESATYIACIDQKLEGASHTMIQQ